MLIERINLVICMYIFIMCFFEVGAGGATVSVFHALLSSHYDDENDIYDNDKSEFFSQVRASVEALATLIEIFTLYCHLMDSFLH